MTSQEYSTAEQQVKAAINASEQKQRKYAFVGLGMIGTAAALGALTATESLDDISSQYDVPYIPAAQQAIESVDTVLEATGKVALPAGLAVVGGSMLLGGSRNRWSETTLDSDGRKSNKARAVAQYTMAGSVPVMASLGAGLAVFSSAIGGAITEGPSQPIESIGDIAPGDAWIVQNDNAKPMVQSNLSTELVGKVMAAAANRDVSATPFALHLGDLEYQDRNYANLSVGMVVPEDSPLKWYKVNGCESVPIAVDEDADIPVGAGVELNGVSAKVVDHTSETSAINRVGVLMDNEALAACVTKGPGNMHAIALETTPQEANEILVEANTNSEAATVITKQRYIENSEDFWRANVKPITNVLSLVALGLAGVAMAKDASSRLFRSRRQWAQKLADGMSVSTLRATELIRSTKEGVAASFIGVAGASAVTPIVGIFESGLHVAVDARAMFVGAAVAITGPVAGTASKLLRLDKTISKSEHTRGN